MSFSNNSFPVGLRIPALQDEEKLPSQFFVFLCPSSRRALWTAILVAALSSQSSGISFVAASSRSISYCRISVFLCNFFHSCSPVQARLCFQHLFETQQAPSLMLAYSKASTTSSSVTVLERSSDTQAYSGTPVRVHPLLCTSGCRSKRSHARRSLARCVFQSSPLRFHGACIHSS